MHKPSLGNEDRREQLIKLINQHGAVSFDLFDTLVTRRVLNPTDIFDIVGQRVKHVGIEAGDFRKNRHEAEMAVKRGNIDDIYIRFGEMFGHQTDVCNRIKREEILCEKEYLLPRYSMAGIMEYAYRKGKIVSVISDMYLPREILEEFMNGIGIRHYHHVFVSCDYGKGKTEGLFGEYRKCVGERTRCLHIGDNAEADIKAPEKYGIKGFGVKSSYDLFMASNIKDVLTGTSDTETVGNIVSMVFNDPFSGII